MGFNMRNVAVCGFHCLSEQITKPRILEEIQFFAMHIAL
jgi:hypothetical protein